MSLNDDGIIKRSVKLNDGVRAERIYETLERDALVNRQKDKNDESRITKEIFAQKIYKKGYITEDEYKSLDTSDILEIANRKIDLRKLITDETEKIISKNVDSIIENTGSQFGYVGYYADINNDGVIEIENDGFIYVDFAIDARGTWGVRNGTFSWGKRDSLKEYLVEESTIDPFNTGRGMIREIPEISGNDRFIVMALKDLDNKLYDWYNNAIGNITASNSVTVTSVGKGISNTNKMLEKWDLEEYGSKNACSNHKDIWDIQEIRNGKGWFIPSKEEWAAFAMAAGIDSSNYDKMGFETKKIYVTSSIYGGNRDYIWGIYFNSNELNVPGLASANKVRLSKMF